MFYLQELAVNYIWSKRRHIEIKKETIRVAASMDQRDTIGSQIREYIEMEFPELAKDREKFIEKGKRVLEEETKKTYFVTATPTNQAPLESRSFKVIEPPSNKKLKRRR